MWPDNPTTGDIHTLDNGTKFQYDGEVWKSLNSLSVDEGSQVTVKLKLSRQPSENVEISAGDVPTGLTVTPETRIYTSTNWDLYQNFVIAADYDLPYETTDLIFNVTGGINTTIGIDLTVVKIYY